MIAKIIGIRYPELNRSHENFHDNVPLEITQVDQIKGTIRMLLYSTSYKPYDAALIWYNNQLHLCERIKNKSIHSHRAIPYHPFEHLVKF